nr:small membrane protein YohP [Escherichia coli]
MKIILWAVLIIFLIGLLVVTGVFKMISVSYTHLRAHETSEE